MPHESSPWRAWWFLVWISFQRQARAHLMLWLSLGLLATATVVIFLVTTTDPWSMERWTFPRGKGPTLTKHITNVGYASSLPWGQPEANVMWMVQGAEQAVVFHGSGFFVFSDAIVFSLFTTFLLPMWSVAFATEGLGREREAQNLLWVLTRPIPRSAIFLAKYVALLPWCLLLNMGGFTLLCLAGGHHGRLALQTYWPAVLWGTLAFSALFHMMGACFRRSAVVALVYAFFLETVAGNMPGHFKRMSISFYTRCLMFERAHEIGVYPERPFWYMPVGGTTAWVALAAVT